MRASFRVVVLLIPLVAGCDKLTALLTKKGDANASTTTAQRAVVPQRPFVPPSDVLATVNGVAIGKADLELRVKELKALTENLQQPWTPLTREELERGLDDLIAGEALSQDAVKRGLDRAPDAQQRWDAVRRNFFAQEWLRWTRERTEVTSQDIEQFYEQYKLGFRDPERRRLRQLLVATEEDAKRALAQLLSGTARFDTLATQISLAPSAKDGGLLSAWVMRAADKALVFPSESDAEAAGITSLDPSLEAAAFAIDRVEGLSSYVKGPDNQFHIFQLVERQEERQRALADVWDQIKVTLTEQRLQQAIEQARKQATIERFPERLERVTQ